MLQARSMVAMAVPRLTTGGTTRWRWARRVVAVLGILLLVEILRVTAWTNHHVVLNGHVYRSAQLSEQGLADFIGRKGIRTVINLRGTCSGFGWYNDECQATHTCNISQEDITLSSCRLPPPTELQRLIDVMDHSEQPFLIHCRRGADRTGLVCALTYLLYSDATMSAARFQHSIRFGHIGLGATGNIDRFFDLYEAWLAKLGIDHTPTVFRHWVLQEYCPGPCRATMRIIGTPQPSRHQGTSIRLWVRNDSIETWQLQPGTRTGVHARFLIAHESGQIAAVGYGGQFLAQVAPGESIELTLPVPPMQHAGKHVLSIDMVDGHDMSFAQVGSPSLLREVIVPE